MAHDRDIAGIRCTEILQVLSDYLDDDVDAELRSRIDAHLSECSWCAHFGGEFSAVIQQVREGLAAPERPDASQTEALLDFLQLKTG